MGISIPGGEVPGITPERVASDYYSASGTLIFADQQPRAPHSSSASDAAVIPLSRVPPPSASTTSSAATKAAMPHTK